MNEHDVLTDEIRACLYEIHLLGAGEYGESLIALVRADERKRIREALLSPDAIQTMLEAGGFPKNAMEQRAFDMGCKEMNAALAAIGLTEEPS